MEIYNGGLILYGAGDFINDYQGIGGHERYRPDLTAGYFVDVDVARAHVTRVLAVPFRLRRFRLERATAADTEWLAETLEAASPAGGVTCRAVDGPAIDCSAV
jgi:poly-gamma-glutamate synthesis protein (capsule biosynthesis protein)